MRKAKILVVDDEIAIRHLFWKALQSTGVLVYQSDSVEKTLDMMERIDFDLFILDVNLENYNDGYNLAQMIRDTLPQVPIIFVSGRDGEEDIITGLEAGADLFITKPFSPKIMRAQILATLDRASDMLSAPKKGKQQSVINEGDFSFDKTKYQLFKKGENIPLSSKEVLLMQFFMENPNQVFTKDQIYNSVWEHNQTESNLVTVYINYLRYKIEVEPKHPIYLKTIWGIGYSFFPDGQSDN
ncbi:MAG: response regulator transcription factor [Lactobacillales bacterium]|jgi:DNA-binding response OmpR family regulator|nr:response regulator transcription factor [Lactobacillales bacterium]